jgi:hypothetical protein
VRRDEDGEGATGRASRASGETDPVATSEGRCGDADPSEGRAGLKRRPSAEETGTRPPRWGVKTTAMPRRRRRPSDPLYCCQRWKSAVRGGARVDRIRMRSEKSRSENEFFYGAVW